jgi:cytochrome P450
MPWLRIDAASRRVSLNSADPGFYNDPYPTYAAIRAVTASFYWEELGMWAFMAMDDVGALLRDRRFGRELVPLPGQAGAPRAPDHMPAFARFNEASLLEREPPAHTRLRTLVSRAFLTRSIERLRPRITALSHELVDAMAPFGRAELLSSYATPIPVTVIAELLGVPTSMTPQLLSWSHRMVAVYELGKTRKTEDDAEAATREFGAYILSHVKERRGRPGDDLITLLIQAEASGERLSENELIATCMLLLNAGHEATVHATGNAVKTLLEHGTDTRRAFADAASTEATIEECLRYDPPLHLFKRFVQEDVTYAGIALRRGDEVALLYGAANRDPSRHARAELFDVRRAPSGASHATFGGGIHFCIGAPLARLEMQVSVPVLFSRLPGLRLAKPPRYRDAYHFHGLDALHVCWD